MLPPCDCITKIVNNFMKGMTFENQMSRFGGDRRIDFFSDGEKKGRAMLVKSG